jgi:hypothetical protein
MTSQNDLNEIELVPYNKPCWLSGMEMDSYKSRISDGVLDQKRNRMSRCLKLHVSMSQHIGTKRIHSHVPGVKGEALFSKLPFLFWVCLPIVD